MVGIGAVDSEGAASRFFGSRSWGVLLTIEVGRSGLTRSTGAGFTVSTLSVAPDSPCWVGGSLV